MVTDRANWMRRDYREAIAELLGLPPRMSIKDLRRARPDIDAAFPKLGKVEDMAKLYDRLLAGEFSEAPKKAHRARPNADRDFRMYSAKKSGMSYQKVAESMGLAISRQRVEQICKRVEAEIECGN